MHAPATVRAALSLAEGGAGASGIAWKRKADVATLDDFIGPKR